MNALSTAHWSQSWSDIEICPEMIRTMTSNQFEFLRYGHIKVTGDLTIRLNMKVYIFTYRSASVNYFNFFKFFNLLLKLEIYHLQQNGKTFLWLYMRWIERKLDARCREVWEDEKIFRFNFSDGLYSSKAVRFLWSHDHRAWCCNSNVWTGIAWISIFKAWQSFCYIICTFCGLSRVAHDTRNAY